MGMEWSIKTCAHHQFDIYIAGAYSDIIRASKQFCTDIGYCVSVFPCEFPYKFGCETGAKITLINYARFPIAEGQLLLKAQEIASYVAEECFQGSYSIVGGNSSTFYTRKE